MNLCPSFSKPLQGGFPRAAAGVLALGLFSGGLFAAATAFAQQAPATAQDDNQAGADAQIESAIVVKLGSSSVLSGQQVAAATMNGEVLLTGSVRDAASKELAESMAYRVAGVKSVVNHLAISNGAPDQIQQDQAQQSQAQAPQDQAPGADQNQGQVADPNQGQVADAGQPPPPPTAASPDQPMTPDDPAESQSPAPPSRATADYPYPSGPAPKDDGSPNQQNPSDQAQGQQGPPPPARRPYDRGYDRNPGPSQPSGPVTLPAGTIVRARTTDYLDAKRLQPGSTFEVSAANDIFVSGVLAVPRGAVMQGTVVEVKNSTSGSLTGSSHLALQLTNLNLEGRGYTLTTDTWTGRGPGKGAESANNTIGGAAFGAVIGAIVGRGPGAAVGAVAGGALGAAGSSASSGPRMVLAPETMLTFHLAQPVTVTPVSQREAQRLASASQRGGHPYLRQRGYYPPPPPPPYYYGAGYPYRSGVWYGGYGW